MEELVEEDDDQGGRDELNDEEEANACTEFGGRTVETGEHVDGCMAKRNDEGKYWAKNEMKNSGKGTTRTFLGTTKQRSVVLETKVDFNEVCSREKLHDHS